MKVVVAPDKFAGTLSAVEAADAIVRGWGSRRGDDRLTSVPMSDGGPGFLAALQSGLGGEMSYVDTTGPHGGAVAARILRVDADVPTAYVEASDCCGLHLASSPRQPLAATSDGLVAVLRAALGLSVRRVVVGVGGTASTDGGRGTATQLSDWPSHVELVVATDVDHPLVGLGGAARSFAPQKGADDREVEQLERRLVEWARVAAIDPEQPGTGAGGGLGYGLMALGAVRISGAELVAQAGRLAEEIREADLVITGEGSVDFSSLRGKVVSVVGGLAMDAARPCVVLAGRVTVGCREAAAVGLDELYSLSDRVGEPTAMAHAADALAELAAHLAGRWGTGQGVG